MFLISALLTLVGVVIFALLPDPELPQGYVEEKQSAGESFKMLVALLKDERIMKMYGLFCNSACAAATA